MKRLLPLFLFALSASFLFANAETQYAECLTLLHEGKTNEAVSKLTALLKKNQKAPIAFDIERTLAETESDYFLAISRYQKLYDNYARRAEREEIGYTIAQLYLVNANYNLALAAYQTLIKEYPDGAYRNKVDVDMGGVYLLQNDPKRAAVCYSNAFVRNENEKNDDYYRAYFGLANAAYQNEDYETALAYALTIAEDNNEFEEYSALLFRIASSYETLGDYEHARERYARIVKDYPESYDANLAEQRLKVLQEAPKNALDDRWNSAIAEADQTPSGAKPVTPLQTNVSQPAALPSETTTYQIGVFSEQPRAEALRAKAISLGYAPFVFEDTLNGKAVYRVRILVPSDDTSVDAMKKTLDKEKIPYTRILDASQTASSNIPVQNAQTTTFQLGRFEDKAKAERLLEQARALGFSAHIRPEEKSGQTEYRVRIVVASDEKTLTATKKTLEKAKIPFFRILE